MATKKKSKTQRIKRKLRKKNKQLICPKVNPLLLVEKGGIVMFQSLEKKVKNYFYHHYNKYAVEYVIEGDKIKVISNIGLYRYVANTKSNIKKLDEAIKKNRITIEEKIDEYEQTNHVRGYVLLFNILMIIMSAGSIVLSFFSGNYFLFLISVIAFSVCVFASTTTGLTYLILVQEIRNLKRATGYKRDLEIDLPKINTQKIKNKFKLIRGQ